MVGEGFGGMRKGRWDNFGEVCEMRGVDRGMFFIYSLFIPTRAIHS